MNQGLLRNEAYNTQMTRRLVVLEALLAGCGMLELWRSGREDLEAILNRFKLKRNDPLNKMISRNGARCLILVWSEW